MRLAPRCGPALATTGAVPTEIDVGFIAPTSALVATTSYLAAAPR